MPSGARGSTSPATWRSGRREKFFSVHLFVVEGLTSRGHIVRPALRGAAGSHRGSGHRLGHRRDGRIPLPPPAGPRARLRRRAGPLDGPARNGRRARRGNAGGRPVGLESVGPRWSSRGARSTRRPERACEASSTIWSSREPPCKEVHRLCNASWAPSSPVVASTPGWGPTTGCSEWGRGCISICSGCPAGVRRRLSRGSPRTSGLPLARGPSAAPSPSGDHGRPRGRAGVRASRARARRGALPAPRRRARLAAHPGERRRDRGADAGAVYARRAAGPARADQRWINHAVRLGRGPYLGRVEATVYAGGWAEIAYVFGLSHRGRGYARAAVAWLIQHVGVEEIWATTRPENTPSRRLLTALGFRECPPSRPLASWDPGDLTYRWDRQR